MADVIHAATTVEVVRRLDIVAAHIRRLVADLHYARCQLGCSDWCIGMVVGDVALGTGTAETNLIQAPVEHVVGKFGVGINGVIVGLDAICVVDGKFRVVLGLYRFVDDAVDYSQRVELERIAGHASVLDLQILLIEITVERWSVMAAVRLGEEIKLLCRTQWPQLCVEFRNSSQESLENMLFVDMVSKHFT